MPKRSLIARIAARGLGLAVIVAALSLTGTAVAGGTIALDEVVSLLPENARLRAEVEEAVAAAGRSEDEVVCTGTRLGNQWQELGGARIPPFECEIGGRMLTIEAETVFFDGDDNEIGADAADAPLIAFRFELREVSWSWK